MAKLLGFSEVESVTISIIGLVVDLDHIFYHSIKYKTLSLKQFKAWAYKEYKIHNPHFYLFHSVYIFLISITLTVLLGGFFHLIFLGIFFHMVIDVSTYLLYFRSFKPWFRYLFYWFLIYIVLFLTDLEHQRHIGYNFTAFWYLFSFFVFTKTRIWVLKRRSDWAISNERKQIAASDFYSDEGLWCSG